MELGPLLRPAACWARHFASAASARAPAATAAAFAASTSKMSLVGILFGLLRGVLLGVLRGVLLGVLRGDGCRDCRREETAEDPDV